MTDLIRYGGKCAGNGPIPDEHHQRKLQEEVECWQYCQGTECPQHSALFRQDFRNERSAHGLWNSTIMLFFAAVPLLSYAFNLEAGFTVVFEFRSQCFLQGWNSWENVGLFFKFSRNKAWICPLIFSICFSFFCPKKTSIKIIVGLKFLEGL